MFDFSGACSLQPPEILVSLTLSQADCGEAWPGVSRGAGPVMKDSRASDADARERRPGLLWAAPPHSCRRPRGGHRQTARNLLTARHPAQRGPFSEAKERVADRSFPLFAEERQVTDLFSLAVRKLRVKRTDIESLAVMLLPTPTFTHTHTPASLDQLCRIRFPRLSLGSLSVH